MASTADLDRYDDIVEPKAFEETLDTYMKNPIMLLQHNSDKPIGRFDETKITDTGLEVKGIVSYNEDECIKKIQDGILGAFSIGYRPKKYEIRNAEGELIATEKGYEKGYNWEDLYANGVVRTIKELDLVEISVVSTPANPNAVFGIEKSVKGFFEKELKNWKEILDEKEAEKTETEAKQEKKQEEEQNTPQESNSEEGEPNEADNIANEVIQKEEEQTETPAESETPADETDGDSETSEVEEEKSLTEEKEVQSLKKEIKSLKVSAEEYRELSIQFLNICEKLNEELESVKKAVQKIPVKK